MKAKLNYYYSLIYPYLIYNVEVWGGTYDCYLKSLIIQHKRVIRTITNASSQDHTSPLFSRLRLLKFPDIYRYYVSIYMYKNHKSNVFRVHHNVNTRSRDLPLSSFNRLSSTQRSITFTGPKIWNSLPVSIRDSESLNKFKRELKSYFISQYWLIILLNLTKFWIVVAYFRWIWHQLKFCLVTNLSE